MGTSRFSGPILYSGDGAENKWFTNLPIGNNPDYFTLMDDFLTRCLCGFVRFEVINDVQSNSSSMGIVHNIDEFSTIIDPSELNAYKQDTYRKAEIYLKDMIDYIEDDDQSGQYPTYEDNRPSGLSVYKNHGIIMYDSIYSRRKRFRTYDSWRDNCYSDDC